MFGRLDLSRRWSGLLSQPALKSRKVLSGNPGQNGHGRSSSNLGGPFAESANAHSRSRGTRSRWSAPAAMAVLTGRLRGALTMAAPLLESAPAVSGGLLDRVATLGDEGFLRRLPALRDGFDVLSPAARQRFLRALSERLSR
jgi:hypothetical protein